MRRCFLLAGFLLGSADLVAQPEARVYYNKFELVGVSAGYTVNRWRYELGGSWNQKEWIGLYASGHPDSLIGGYIAYPVFEDDVWTHSKTTITGRILRTAKKSRPRFGWYYGIYLRCTLEKSKLTEAHWSEMEYDMATRYTAVMSVDSWRICTGLVFGARGTIAAGLFWDVNVAILPIIFMGKENWHNYDGRVDTYPLAGATYFAENSGYFFQIGLGYRFGKKESE